MSEALIEFLGNKEGGSARGAVSFFGAVCEECAGAFFLLLTGRLRFINIEL